MNALFIGMLTAAAFCLGWQFRGMYNERRTQRRLRQAFEQAQRTRATVVLSDDRGCCCQPNSR